MFWSSTLIPPLFLISHFVSCHALVIFLSCSLSASRGFSISYSSNLLSNHHVVSFRREYYVGRDAEILFV